MVWKLKEQLKEQLAIATIQKELGLSDEEMAKMTGGMNIPGIG